MVRDKQTLKRKIFELDFALHELVLFLDTHPESREALALTEDFRTKRAELVKLYEEHYGKLVITPADVKPEGRWGWIDSPWPWEINFSERM